MPIGSSGVSGSGVAGSTASGGNGGGGATPIITISLPAIGDTSLAGTSSPNDTVTIAKNGSDIGTALCDGAGAWSFLLGTPVASGDTYSARSLLSATGTVPTALGISGTPSPATVNVAYNWVPTVTGGNGSPKLFALTAGTLPAGLSFSTSTGAITGVPLSASTASGLAIRVTDSTGLPGAATLSGLSIVVSSGASPLRLGATFGDVPVGILAAADSATQRRIYRMRHYFSGPNNHTELRIVLCNYWVSGGTNGEKLVGNSVTRSVTVEGLSATPVPVKWGGATSVVLGDGDAFVISDALTPADFGIATFTANSLFYLRHNCDMAVGAFFPYCEKTGFIGVAGSGGAVCSLATDGQLGNNGAIVNSGSYAPSAYALMPIAILTRTASPNLAVGLYGDSIVYRNNDTNGDGTSGNGGYAQIAMYNFDSAGTHAGYSRLACIAETSVTFASNNANGGNRRRQVLPYCSHVYTDWGTNDIFYPSGTLAVIQASIDTNIANFTSYPGSSVRRVAYGLIMPRTNAANNAHVAPSSNANFTYPGWRETINTQITGSSGVNDVVNFNIDVEDGSNLGYWTPALPLPSDGVHPAASVHQGVLATRLKGVVNTWVPSF